MANPPYVPSVMDNMARFLLDAFDTATNLLCIISVPHWDDEEAIFYNLLNASQYRQLNIVLNPGMYYYVDSSNQNEVVEPSKAVASIFVLGKGYTIDYEMLKRDILAAYK